MLEREVPCNKCDETREMIEEDGLWEYVSCEEIPAKPDWCKLLFRPKEE